LSELGDYKRLVEKPMIESYEATIKAQREQIARLTMAQGWRPADLHTPTDDSRVHILTNQGRVFYDVRFSMISGEACWVNNETAVMCFADAVAGWMPAEKPHSPMPDYSRRRLIVGTADYWYQCARDPQYTLCERLLYMENALNHTEHHLVEELRSQGKDLKL